LGHRTLRDKPFIENVLTATAASSKDISQSFLGNALIELI
jgi:hypothetical protein